jgi:hypothetical protein
MWFAREQVADGSEAYQRHKQYYSKALQHKSMKETSTISM